MLNGSDGSGLRRTRRRARRAAILVPALFLVSVLSAFVRLPLVVVEAGPAPDVGKRTEIDADTYPSAGSMHLTTAQVRYPTGATAVQVFVAAVDDDQSVYSRELVYPSGSSDQHTRFVQAAQMSFSELEAAAAALSEVGMPIEPAGAFIADLTEDAPAARELRPGDIITEVEGRPVRLLEDLAAALEEVEAGDPIALETLRQGRPRPVTVTAVAPEGDRSALGIVAVQYHRPPVEVSISADDIGGPSAGLMFALFIYDQLVPEDLTGGRTIAGTGTIQTGPQGSARVGEVGSVELKVKGALRLGADVFLVPREELQRARREAGDRLEVVGVSTLRDAVDALS